MVGTILTYIVYDKAAGASRFRAPGKRGWPFSTMARRHIERWGPRDLKPIGHAKIAGHLVPRYSSELFVRRNKPGRREFAGTYCLKMDGGIAVVPDELPIAPRLPLLGIQTILGNRLRLLIDGDRRQVTLRTNGWF